MSTTTAPQPTSTGLVGQPVSTRLLSIDIFRGVTMAVMIFVNELDDVHGFSRWWHHIPRDVDAMSFVDMVYPFFLFAVGLSLPLAITQRLRRDPSQLRLWGHILLRTVALITLGLILANAGQTSRMLTHMRGGLWAILALLGAILIWAVYPRTLSPRLTWTARALGIALLATMLALFRRWTPDHHSAWINFRYPEILGLIGLTYLATCLLYIPSRRLTAGPLVCFALLFLFNIATIAHWLTYPRSMYLFPFDNGAMLAITIAGVLVSTLFLNERLRAQNNRPHLYALTFAALCALLGLALRPLGISKIRATPTWALWSIAAATALFTFIYWLCDQRHHTRWAAPFRAPGANTLLTYLLPDLTYFALGTLGLAHFLGRWSYGLPGLTRSLIFTAAMLLASHFLTRARIRLQL